jgi:hypothetical protein
MPDPLSAISTFIDESIPDYTHAFVAAIEDRQDIRAREGGDQRETIELINIKENLDALERQKAEQEQSLREFEEAQAEISSKLEEWRGSSNVEVNEIEAAEGILKYLEVRIDTLRRHIETWTKEIEEVSQSEPWHEHLEAEKERAKTITERLDRIRVFRLMADEQLDDFDTLNQRLELYKKMKEDLDATEKEFNKLHRDLIGDYRQKFAQLSPGLQQRLFPGPMVLDYKDIKTLIEGFKDITKSSFTNLLAYPKLLKLADDPRIAECKKEEKELEKTKREVSSMKAKILNHMQNPKVATEDHENEAAPLESFDWAQLSADLWAMPVGGEKNQVRSDLEHLKKGLENAIVRFQEIFGSAAEPECAHFNYMLAKIRLVLAPPMNCLPLG